MTPLPCPRCGYHAPRLPCPHCGDSALVASLAGPPPRGFGEVGAGLRALPLGLAALWSTPRTKRWLLPPLALTAVVFLLLFVGAWSVVRDWIAVDPAARASADAAWYERILRSELVSNLFAAGTYLILFVLVLVLAVATFAVVYQAVATPFLDLVQGRVERRWFGCDPRERLAPPAAITTWTAVWITTGCAAAALVLIAVGLAWDSSLGWFLVAASPLPFVFAARARREWGAWFAHVARREGRAFLLSLASSAVAAAWIVAFSWTIFLPVVGMFVFSALAGFAAAITLLDVPFARRGFTFGQRLAFVFGHFGAVFAFGATTSLAFLVPLIGPALAVPIASVGGQWLLCRLDKRHLARRGPFPPG